MPDVPSDGSVSKEEGEETESRTEALALLYCELLRSLYSKDILGEGDINDIFANAVEESSPQEEEIIQSIYEYFLGTFDDDGDDLDDEEADSENEP
ncbi:MAG: hypothetical protein ACJ754_26580 [Pyrinomonadaceae bacterium]